MNICDKCGEELDEINTTRFTEFLVCPNINCPNHGKLAVTTQSRYRNLLDNCLEE